MHFSERNTQPPPRFSPLSANPELLRPDTFQCQECPDAFSPGMTPHLAVECPIKRHLCFVCGRQFSIILALTMHMTMHEKPQSNGFINVNGVRSKDVTDGKQTLPPFSTLDNQSHSTVPHRSAFGRTDESTGELVVTVEGSKRGRRLPHARRTRRPAAAARGARRLSTFTGSWHAEGSAAGIAPRGFPQETAPRDMVSADVASTSCPTPQLHRCSICGLRFVSRDKLRLHSMCVHDAPTYTCKKCLSCFEQEEELANHVRVVHGCR
ncbi:hypothetical protein MTO96_042399 [Rhipicephalus appendiculatus]